MMQWKEEEYWIPGNKLIFIAKCLAIIQGWAPRSFAFWTHRSFEFFLRMQRSFMFFFRFFGDLWDPKEWCVLLRSFLKNVREHKERKRTQRTQCSFAKKVKERRECNVLMQKNAKERSMLRSFEKNACPTLVLF